MSMREKMPHTAAFIDSLREAIGHEAVSQAIREGLRDGTFHAKEAGHEIGERQPEGDGVRLCDMAPYNDQARGLAWLAEQRARNSTKD